MRTGVAVLAVLALAGCGSDHPRLGSNLRYERNSLGIIAYYVDAQFFENGTVTVTGDPSSRGCPPGRVSVQLPPDRTASLRKAIATADLPNAKSLQGTGIGYRRIRSGQVDLEYSWPGELPPEVRPLVVELESAVSFACGTTHPVDP